MIDIWNPRWHDRIVLIAPWRVRDGINEIKFTKAKSLKDKVYTIHSEDIRKHHKESNGKAMCYAVPMAELKEVI